MELNILTGHRLIELLNKKDISPIDICNSIINKIEKAEKSLNALAHFDKDVVLKRAGEGFKPSPTKVNSKPACTKINRKFVLFIYLEGGKFYKLRD